MARQKQRSRQRGRHAPEQSLWQWRKAWFIGGGVAGAIGLLAVLISALSGPETTAGGEPAPDIALATADGAFRLSDHRGEVSLLYFSFPG